jgi:hypothetical protein
MIRTTYTYAVLDISAEAYLEIAALLKAAGYDQAFHRDDGRTVIDMHGIALANSGQKSPIRVALGDRQAPWEIEIKEVEGETRIVGALLDEHGGLAGLLQHIEHCYFADEEPFRDRYVAILRHARELLTSDQWPPDIEDKDEP